MKLACFLLLLMQAVGYLAKSAMPLGTLVLYDGRTTDLAQYTKLLDSLKNASSSVETKEINDQTVSLFRNGVRIYQNLLLLPTKVRTLGADLTSAAILEFVDDGGDVVTVTNPSGLSESVRGFLNQLGVYPSPRNHQLVDYFVGGESNRVIALTSNDVVENIIVELDSLEYEGSSALIKNSPQLIPLLQAPTTSFTKDLKNDDPTENNWTVGRQGYLAVAHQALNNARSLWIGDASLLQDSKFESFAKDAISWVTQSKHVIKATKIEHSHVDGTSYEEKPYKIKDDISYKIYISEWTGTKWVPFVAEDVQVDIRLLDPYHRLTLAAVGTTDDAMIYGTQFKLPDHHGVFSFHVDYKRPGYSFVDEKNILSIRHLANDEYPRSWEITNSWVYVTSIAVVLVSWIVFLLGFIYSKNPANTTDKKNK